MAPTQSFVRVPPDSTGKLIDAFLTSVGSHYRQAIVIADPEIDGQYCSIGSDGRLPVTTIVTAGTLSNVTVTGGTLSNVTVATCALPSGAATTANQVVQIAWASTIQTQIATTGIVVATAALPPSAANTTNQLSFQGSKTGGTSATNSALIGGIYNTTAPTLTNGQQASAQLDSSGNLKVSIVSGPSGGTSSVDKAAFTSGTTSGTPIMGAYETSPTTVGASTAVAMAGLSVTRQLLVSAQVTTSALPSNAAIETGGNLATIAGAVSSSRVQVNTIVGQGGLAAGAGSVSASTQRTTLASDDPAVTALQIMDDWDETDRAKVNLVVGQAGVAASSGTTTVNTLRVSFATDTAAITAIVPGTSDTQLGKAEDATHTSGATGVLFLGVRADAPAAGTSTTGDYAAPQSDQNGSMWVTNHYGDTINERTTNTNGTSTAFSNFGATANVRNYIHALSVFRTDTGTSVEYVDFRDGTSGTVLFSAPLPPGGGSVIAPGYPFIRGTANTALAYDVSSALTTVYISVAGFQRRG